MQRTARVPVETVSLVRLYRPLQENASHYRLCPKHIAKLQKDMQMQMLQLVAGEIDVAEIYSRPRVTQRAKQWGLKPGWSLDITTKDADGEPWDFSKRRMRKKAIDKINKDKPLLIIGSPMCTDWSTMMNLNWDKMSPEEWKRRMRAARKHLRFCVKVYQHQVAEGRYFVHEHPYGAKSWQ